MADLPRSPDSNRDADGDSAVRPGRGSTVGTPRWVKVFGIIAVVLVVMVGVLLLSGGGNHGPGRHTSSGDVAGHNSPALGHTP